MPDIRRLLTLVLFVFAVATVHAQAASSVDASVDAVAATPAQSLTALDKQLDTIRAALHAAPPTPPLGDLRNNALRVQVQADQLVGALAPQMDSLNARLAVFGPEPAKGTPAEAPEVRTQRRQLDRDKAALDAQIKQAQLLGEESLQLAAQVAGLRRDQFQAQLTSRTATPFSRAFWVDPARLLPQDLARLQHLGRDVADDVRAAWLPANRQPLIVGIVGALLLLLVGRRLLERALLAFAVNGLPGARLRRSAMAVAVTLTAVLTTGLAAQMLHWGVNWHGTLDSQLEELAAAVVRLIYFAAFVAGLGRALLSVAHPSWRLPALSDHAAKKLRPFPWLLAGALLLLGLLERVNGAIGASLPATVTTRGVIALVISGLIGAALWQLGRARRVLPNISMVSVRPLWVGLLTTLAGLGVIASWLGVATGFIAFAFFTATHVLWIGMIVGTLYVLMHVSDDLFETLLGPQGRTGQRLQTAFSLAPARLDQAATVCSGVVRVLLVLLAIGVVLAPFGAGPQELLARIGQLLSGGTLGRLPIVPSDIFMALLVFVVGMAAIHLLKRWLTEQLLPTTTIEPGLQNSIVTLLGYLAGVLVFVLALAALKVNLQSIAWIASALSVGIGFGLQAIVQNFISGLILLAERPVKVGDWVSLSSDVEGDIQRINVRATEIRMGDRSTVIVPNSQLITQTVRNVTLGNALGRVQIKLPMPLDTDAMRAREIILDAFDGHTSLLASPEPSVLLGHVDNVSMTFVCTGYVTSPRDVGHVKSDLLFSIFDQLRSAKLPLIRPQDMRVHTLMPASEPAPAAGKPMPDDSAAALVAAPATPHV